MPNVFICQPQRQQNLSKATAVRLASAFRRVSCHQQLVSPIIAPIVKMPKRSGAALVREFDHAAIERAVLLSETYRFAEERKGLSDRERITRD